MTGIQKKISMVAVNVGKAMAKVSMNTACPWINFQPVEPETVTKMRKSKKRRER